MITEKLYTHAYFIDICYFKRKFVHRTLNEKICYQSTRFSIFDFGITFRLTRLYHFLSSLISKLKKNSYFQKINLIEVAALLTFNIKKISQVKDINSSEIFFFRIGLTIYMPNNTLFRECLTKLISTH